MPVDAVSPGGTARGWSWRRISGLLAGAAGRGSPGDYSHSGGLDSPSLSVRRRGGLPVLFFAILAALCFSLLLLTNGGLVQAQDDDTIMYPENGTAPVATYTATDPEGTSVRWSLGGVDAPDFMIANGVLSFKKSPNFESAIDANRDNTYVVEVQATDETRRMKSETVTIKVTNVDEAGKVTLSARRPQTDTMFTAMVTDPDDGVADVKWQWAKAGSKSGSYRNINGATSATYIPKDADSGSYLRATATYEDTEGEGKTAMMMSEFPSQRITGGNRAPEFAAVQDPDGADAAAKAIAKREVAENTTAGKTVGSPVVATDSDNDTITYSLTDHADATGDSDHFSINWATGQILTKKKLDAENADSSLTDRDATVDGLQLQVVVRATDPSGIPGAATPDTANSDVVTVMITVMDVNEAPVVATTDTLSPFNEVVATDDLETGETSGDITVALATYTATDEDATDSNPTTFTLAGPDGSKFTAVEGALKFKDEPDYEKPTDADMDNVYEVTVQASDGKLTGMRKVEVKVANVGEAGTVNLDKAVLVVGIPVKATLKDPDLGISKLTWAWVESGSSTTVSTSNTYTPKAGDVGNTLTVTASYFDGESAVDATTKKTAARTSAAVERDTRNKAPVFGDEDPDTSGVQNSAATRTVEENTTGNVGVPVAATDTKADGTAETLQYSLSGVDAGKFRVRQDDSTTTDTNEGGQIEVASGTKLDYETKSTYMVTVTARDPLGAFSSISVTITVTNVDEPPEIMQGGLAISGRASVSYAENGADAVGTYRASGPNAASATWTLEGADMEDFMLEGSGMSVMLKFSKAPDFENPADSDTNNVYMVTLKAVDSENNMDTHDVVVTVTDVEESAETLLDRYDENNNDKIDRDEVLNAIDGFFASPRTATREEVLDLIDLFFEGLGS